MFGYCEPLEGDEDEEAALEGRDLVTVPMSGTAEGGANEVRAITVGCLRVYV